MPVEMSKVLRVPAHSWRNCSPNPTKLVEPDRALGWIPVLPWTAVAAGSLMLDGPTMLVRIDLLAEACRRHEDVPEQL